MSGWNDRLPGLAPYAGVFTHGLGQTIVMATLPPLGREIGLQEIAIGAIISASAFVFFVFGRIWGRASDRTGRKPVIVIGLVGYAIGTLAFAGMFWLGMHGIIGGLTLWGLIIGVRMLQASVMSATGPATSAYIADITSPTTRTAGMGKLAAAQNIGSILGPGLAGLLAAVSLLAPLVFAAVFAGATAFLVQRHLVDSGKSHSQQDPKQKMRFSDPRVRRVLTLSLVVFTAFSVVQQTLAFRIQDTLMLTASDTARLYGYTMIASAICSLTAQIALVQRLRLAPLMLLRIGIPLILLSMSLLVFAESMTTFTVAMGILGVGLGVSGPGLNAAASLAVSAEEQGAVAGLSMSMPAMGFVAGPLIGTGLYQLQPASPYAFTCLLLAGACVYTYRSAMVPNNENGPD